MPILYELGCEYAQTASTIRVRIVELKKALNTDETDDDKARLQRRLHSLIPMYRDAREIARWLEHFYIKHVPNQHIDPKKAKLNYRRGLNDGKKSIL